MNLLVWRVSRETFRGRSSADQSARHPNRTLWLTVNGDFQEAKPAWHILLSKVVGDEDPLDHQADVVDAAGDLLPEVGRELGGDVHNGAVRDACASVALGVSSTQRASSSQHTLKCAQPRVSADWSFATAL